MKKLFVLLFVLFCFVQINYADVTKLRTSGVATQYKNEYSGVWDDWGAWEDCNVLIVIDEDRDRITIYSQRTQEYDIIGIGQEEEDYESSSLTFDCVDEEGIRCSLTIRVYNNNSLGSQLYVNYNDIRWVYSIPSNY